MKTILFSLAAIGCFLAVAMAVDAAATLAPPCDVLNGASISPGVAAALAVVADEKQVAFQTASGMAMRLDLALCARSDIAARKTSGLIESCGRAFAMLSPDAAPCGTLFNDTVRVTENVTAAVTRPSQGVTTAVVSITLAAVAGSSTRVTLHFACSAASQQSELLASSGAASPDDLSDVFLATPVVCPDYIARLLSPPAPRSTKHPELAIKRGFVVLVIVCGVALTLIVATVTQWAHRLQAEERPKQQPVDDSQA